MGKHYYTQAKREALCKEYLASNQSRKEFCKSYDISTKSLSRWLSGVSKLQVPKFISIGKLADTSGISTEILLSNGICIKLTLKVSEVSGLIKELAS